MSAYPWVRPDECSAVEIIAENGWLWMGGDAMGGEDFLYHAIQTGKHGTGLITGTIAQR